MSHSLVAPSWGTEKTRDLVDSVAEAVAHESPAQTQSRIENLSRESHRLHDVAGLNLNPATNILNPRAEAILASGLSSRASLGHPGDKYETGLDAIEQIEIATAELACEVFGSRYSEFRIASGALANLYGFMATTSPGDTIIAPPATIGGHVTHQQAGAAGLYGLKTIAAPIDPYHFTVDLDALRKLAHNVLPKLITIGGSLNLFEHPVAAVREIADEVGAKVLFDAAHQCGLIAGRVWSSPLEHGAHVMTLSTYKSLGGPAGGLLVTNDDDLAAKVDAIAYPGLTANFDAAKTAALGITLADWKAVGMQYAQMMVATARTLASCLHEEGVKVYAADRGFTMSHQFAVLAAPYGGGQTAAKVLGRAGLLACGIGLPEGHVEGDLAGLRIGTPELVRIGMKESDMPAVAQFIRRGLDPKENPDQVAVDLAQWRSQFSGVHYTVDLPE
ncbi:MAG: beta-eliminating lyase-related protein [Actinomycetes bacterium]